MAGLSPYAAAPPPPPISASGNRKNKHIVGGDTSNVSYMPGQNLLSAREGYQANKDLGFMPANALQRGMFQGQVAEAPDFSQTGTNALPAGQGLTSAQAAGNTLFQQSLGNIRPANAPAGLGFGRSNALGAVRQHTLTGNEAMDSGMTYTPAPTPPPPPVTNTSTGGTTATGSTSGGQYQTGQDPIKNQNGNVNRWTPPDNVKVGDATDIAGATFYGRVKLSNGQYAPIIKYANGTSQIHPSWQRWMQANNVVKASDPIQPAPPAGTPAPAPATPAPVGPPAPEPARWTPPANIKVGGATDIAGTTFAGRIQLSNGQYAPLIKYSNGTTVVHPSWQRWMKATGVVKKRG